MLVVVWCRNDGIGLPNDFRNGDPMLVFPDSFEASLGTQDKKSYLILKMPDAPGFPASMEGFFEPEFSGTDEGGNPVRTRARKYTIDWESKFTAEERAIISDYTQQLGTGVVDGKFTVADIVAKN